MRGDAKNDHLNIQQQLVSVQELTGQSQQRLSELRSQLEQRAAQPVPAPDTGHGAAGPSGGATADQMYDASLQQYRKGSVGTARMGFRQFLQTYPTEHARRGRAVPTSARATAIRQPDSAAPVYAQLVKTYPNSIRAPTTLYKLGLLSEKSDKALAPDVLQPGDRGLPPLGRGQPRPHPAPGTRALARPPWPNHGPAARCRSSSTSRSSGGVSSAAPSRADARRPSSAGASSPTSTSSAF